MWDSDKLYEDDMDFDYMIKRYFGPKTRHITNFPNNQIDIYKEVIRLTSLDDVLFIDKAYINGLKELKGASGLYSTTNCDLSYFWDIFDSLKIFDKGKIAKNPDNHLFKYAKGYYKRFKENN